VLNGKPIIISSGLRTKKVNDAVGSRDTSQHRLGCAADFRVPGMTPDQVVKAIVASGIGYDQVIREFDRWTHISVPNSVDTSPRKQALIIDKAGTRPYA
jgi:zinc D-Ala-D-Ala carboxypeptidase